MYCVIHLFILELPTLSRSCCSPKPKGPYFAAPEIDDVLCSISCKWLGWSFCLDGVDLALVTKGSSKFPIHTSISLLIIQSACCHSPDFTSRNSCSASCHCWFQSKRLSRPERFCDVVYVVAFVASGSACLRVRRRPKSDIASPLLIVSDN